MLHGEDLSAGAGLWFCRQLRFSVLDFEFVTDFDIWISNFLFGCGWRPRSAAARAV